MNDKKKRTILEWWASNPMTYGDQHGETIYVTDTEVASAMEIGTREFFEVADNTFYNWNVPLHSQEGYFSKIFDYKRYQSGNILEVGCGLGCMAMNWAKHGAKITAVDLNPTAVHMTKKRFKVFDLPESSVMEADAENLPFSGGCFDYVYSWGVLHHTPNIQSALDDIYRVLRPGGEIGIMLYHRHSLLYWYFVQYLEGFVHMENAFLDSLELSSRYSDGAEKEGNPHTWPVTRREVYQLMKRFDNLKIQVLGTDLPHVLDKWMPALGQIIFPQVFIRSLARRWGWSLWITASKGR